uniref:Putative ribosomal protein S6 kinase alpha-1 n=1 Tax=Zeugodacus cucurbitae TaxID=28588 RepID=A0A0A1XLB8_ZEUCU
MDAASVNTHKQECDYPSAKVLTALQQLLERQYSSDSFTYQLFPATKKGENYIGIVYRVSINLNTSFGIRFSNLILKMAPRNSTRRKQFFIRPCFQREALAYEEFLPMIDRFQCSKGLPEEYRFHEYAKCFYTSTNALEEVIFLEDLSAQQFVVFDRFDDFQFEHIALVMRTYAKLHAVSFAIKDQQPEALHKFRNIQDIFLQHKNDSNLNIYFEGLKRSALACLELKNDEYRKILSTFFERPFFEIFSDLIDGNKGEPYAVLCHGDCWNNNLMFKLKDTNAVTMRLLDWQLLRYSSPISDLMYFIFTCTTRKFRKAHYEDALNVYYEELIRHINRLGSNPLKLFPREKFDKELKNRGALALLFAMIVLPIITLKSEDVPDLDKLSEQADAGKLKNLMDSGLLCEGNLHEYSQRMHDVIIDCIHFGYIY